MPHPLPNSLTLRLNGSVNACGYLTKISLPFQGIVDIQFISLSDNVRLEEGDVYQMVESTVYFEAYRHVLEGLKEVDPAHLPLQVMANNPFHNCVLSGLAWGDLALIQTALLFHVNQVILMHTSPQLHQTNKRFVAKQGKTAPAALLLKGHLTQHTTIKWNVSHQ